MKLLLAFKEKVRGKMNENLQLIKDYRDNNQLRQSFNQLAIKTFGLNFEDWYQNGYWKEKYIPYSILHENEIVANVSVNIMQFIFEGERKNYIQLGTVMTDEKYRGQGLAKRLIREIEKDYQDKTDGYYLFANDSVLDFYPKFGYEKAVEYQYEKEVSIQQEKSIIQLSMKNKKQWKVLEEAIENSVPNSRLEMVNNTELIMFYVTKFMQDNVYYNERQDTYVIAEIEEGRLFIHNVFSKTKVDIDEMIHSFGSEVRHVVLGFTPIDNRDYDVIEVSEEDTTLFVKGISDFNKSKSMFPTLSHA